MKGGKTVSRHETRQQTTAGGRTDSTQKESSVGPNGPGMRTERKVPMLISTIGLLASTFSAKASGARNSAPHDGQRQLHLYSSSCTSFLTEVLRGVMPEKEGSLMRNTRSSTSSTAGQAGRRAGRQAGSEGGWAGGWADRAGG